MSRETVRVCFVCLGNICRSPTAEGVMRAMIEAEGFEEWIEVDSAGTAAYHTGELPDKRARQAARRRGLSLDSRARQFDLSDFRLQHYVLAMDRENLSNLEALRADLDGTGRLSLLREFDPLAPRGAEIADPYYGGDTGFETVLDQCEAACRGLIETIRKEWGGD